MTKFLIWWANLDILVIFVLCLDGHDFAFFLWFRSLRFCSVLVKIDVKRDWNKILFLGDCYGNYEVMLTLTVQG